MAAHGRDLSRLHPCRSPSDDPYFLRMIRLSEFQYRFPASFRIDGTLEGTLPNALNTAVTGDTGNDLFASSFHRLPGKVGVRDQCPSHRDQIGFALFQYPVGQFRGTDSAYSDDGNSHHRFDPLSKMDDNTFLRVIGRMIQK